MNFLVANILCDKELDRAKAVRVELIYVILQVGILFLGKLLIGNILSLVLSGFAFWVYVVKINGRKLNRPLYIDKTKKQSKQDGSSPDFQ